MPAENSSPLADTSDMVWLHQVFRDALQSTVRLLAPVSPGDTARAEVVGSYYDNVLRLLHGHHESEDVLMTPKLLERRPDHAATINRIGEQHEAVFSTLNDAETALGVWRADPTWDNNVNFSRQMVALQLVLWRHLDEEEELLVPLAATCITADEWAELPAHGMKAFTGDKPWLITGLIQEQMPPDRIALMEANMPPTVLEFWTSQGRSMFEEYIVELRGKPEEAKKKPPKLQTIAQLIGTTVGLLLIVYGARAGHADLAIIGGVILVPSIVPWMSDDVFGH